MTNQEDPNLRDTDPTELKNDVPHPSIPATVAVPAISVIPSSVLECIFEELRGVRAAIAAVQADTDKEWRPKWVDEILSFTERVIALEDWRRQREYACRDCPQMVALGDHEA